MKRHTFAILTLLGILIGVPVAYSQGAFPWVYPFAGVQPQNTIDFSNPPISIKVQGQTNGNNVPVSSIELGSVAYASLGNATTYGASTTIYVTSIFVPFDMTVTNINCLAGGTVGTNSIIGTLYNSAGTLLGNSATAGTATSGANTFQTLALTATKAIQGPSVYYIGIQANGTTDNLRTIATATFIGRLGAALTSQPAFGSPAAITVPTTFTANTAPICYLN